jgi:NitT/TauT family transport system substrate-binding protein
MRRTLIFAQSILIASLACARPDSQPAKHEMRKVRVSFSPLLSWGPLMIANAEGFFRDEGLEVEFVSTLSSQEELVALVTGDIDVMPGPTHAGFLSAIAQGATIRIVAGQGYLARDGCTYYGIVRRRNPGPASSIKRVRASQDGLTGFVTSRMLESEDIEMTRLDVMKLPDPVLSQSLESGSIDAVAASEPTLTRLKTSVGSLWLSAEKTLPDFQWGTIAFGERLLYRDRETGARFLRAYRRGVVQYEQGKTDRNVAIISRETGETPALARAACWLPFRADLRVNWESIQAFQAWANKEGIMEHTLSLDQAMDSSFLSEISPASTAAAR